MPVAVSASNKVISLFRSISTRIKIQRMVGKTKNQILSPAIILMLQGTSKEQIQVALDNTLPEVSIIAPKDKENVQQGINLLG